MSFFATNSILSILPRKGFKPILKSESNFPSFFSRYFPCQSPWWDTWERLLFRYPRTNGNRYSGWKIYWTWRIQVNFVKKQLVSYIKKFKFLTKRNKVHLFWEGHKILRNLHLTFDYGTYLQSKVRGRFRKILWPSQNI